MAWLASLALLGVLYLFFDSSLQARNNPNHALRIAPGAELILQRNGDGHYVFPG
ncbi:MAG: aspartyl protease, partial [Hydrogenophilales bacterium 16-64-40]